ncbi:hypothetical protein M2267_001027 [Ensifer sp. KUDG1]|uniref:hypothetical protein n=1 Tax=Ensifer sp. KUDG1 TaxID=3373919 RepID=UPI003D210BF4
MYAGEREYDEDVHYFEVAWAKRPDVTSCPVTYFARYEDALGYATFLNDERQCVWISEREKDADWKVFWWGTQVTEFYEYGPQGRGFGVYPDGTGHDNDRRFYRYVPLDPEYHRKGQPVA